MSCEVKVVCDSFLHRNKSKLPEGKCCVFLLHMAKISVLWSTEVPQSDRKQQQQWIMVHRWSRSGSQDTVSHDISMLSGPEQAEQLADPRPAGSTDLVDAIVRNTFHAKHILKFSLNSFTENVSLSSSVVPTNSRETVRGGERGMRPANVTECYVDESRIRRIICERLCFSHVGLIWTSARGRDSEDDRDLVLHHDTIKLTVVFIKSEKMRSRWVRLYTQFQRFLYSCNTTDSSSEQWEYFTVAGGRLVSSSSDQISSVSLKSCLYSTHLQRQLGGKKGSLLPTQLRFLLG